MPFCERQLRTRSRPNASDDEAIRPQPLMMPSSLRSQYCFFEMEKDSQNKADMYDTLEACLGTHLGYILERNRPKGRRTVIESNVWSGEIPPDGQDSEVSKLGNLYKIGARLDEKFGVSNAYLGGCKIGSKKVKMDCGNTYAGHVA